MTDWPRAISNTSPLLYLHRVGGLDWLPRIYTEIWTPDAVADELAQGRSLGYDTPDLAGMPWLQVKHPQSALSHELAASPGPGERAAIALAQETSGRVLLLDDAAARDVASHLGLALSGTLGVILEAMRPGLIGSVTPVVDALQHAGMWISAAVRQRILALAGE